jgi:SAM-dependent methyltransferase
MHPTVAAEFERILRACAAGGAVLEIGARPSPDTLLALPALRNARERVGLDLDGPHDGDGFRIERGDANHMPFPDRRFDTVVCNSVLEHDPRFWLTLAEIRRVARPGAVVVLGVPGYVDAPSPLQPLGRLTWLPLVGPRLESALASTSTLLVHRYPGDYYRFSEQAMREILLEGLVGIETHVVMRPPRLVGAGRIA